MQPSLNFKVVGQGKPIIILHGLFGMMDNWLNIAKKLETEGYMVFLIDQRDHGRSSHTDAFNYQLLSDDLLQFMEDNWIYESILIGHSMGGKTGLQFVSQHESMISKFVAIDIGIKTYEGGHENVFDALFAVDIETVESREQVEKILMAKLNDLGTTQFLMKNLTRKKEGGFEWKMNIDLLYKEYKNILAGIDMDEPCKTETLFIRGSKSDYIEDEDIPVLKQAFPNSTLVTIEGAGHWVHVDRPDELFEQIISFIRE